MHEKGAGGGSFSLCGVYHAVDHALHFRAGVCGCKLNIRVMRRKNNKQLMRKALPDAFHTGEVFFG